MDSEIAMQHIEERVWNCSKIVLGITGIQKDPASRKTAGMNIRRGSGKIWVFGKIQGSFCRSGKRNGQRCGNGRCFVEGRLFLKFEQKLYLLKKCMFLSHKNHLSS